MVLSGLKKHLNSLKISYKVIMMIVTKETFLKLVFNILKIYIAFTMIYSFCLKEGKLDDKKKYVIHVRNLKQVLNHGLVLEKVRRVMKLNQETWLKSYIDMNTELRKKAINDLEKDFFKLMKNSVSGKTMENVTKIEMSTFNTESRRDYLVPEPNYHATNSFFRKCIVNRNEKNTNVHE